MKGKINQEKKKETFHITWKVFQRVATFLGVEWIQLNCPRRTRKLHFWKKLLYLSALNCRRVKSQWFRNNYFSHLRRIGNGLHIYEEAAFSTRKKWFCSPFRSGPWQGGSNPPSPPSPPLPQNFLELKKITKKMPRETTTVTVVKARFFKLHRESSNSPNVPGEFSCCQILRTGSKFKKKKKNLTLGVWVPHKTWSYEEMYQKMW